GDRDVRALVYYGVDADDLTSYDVDVVRGDITEPESLDGEVFEDVDEVVHCAGVNHPSYWHGVSRIHEVNATGTKNLLSAGQEHGIEQFVYVSSIMAHGFNESPETDWTPDMETRPDTEYGRSKLRAEQHVRAFQRDHGIEYTIVRPCWYYGPRQPPRMATLMQSIQGGRPIMFGDGTNRRSMMYVPSLVDLLIAILDRPEDARNEIYDVGDQHTYTTNQIYETMARYLDVEEVRPRRLREPIPTLVGVAQRIAERLDVHVRELHVGWEMAQDISCDPSKAMEDLDWSPPSRLDPGMETAIEWAREHGQVE
ncbi:MAG: NAD-dependent epimerase/dehydratase family protein, partial [Halanaeroarchaeum sp.]